VFGSDAGVLEKLGYDTNIQCGGCGFGKTEMCTKMATCLLLWL